MTARTAAQRGSSNRWKGQQAERDAAAYFRSRGFTACERAVVTGWTVKDGRAQPDPGDLKGLPGTVVSIKDVATPDITGWWSELETMCDGDELALRLLVHKRRRALPARWYAYLRADQHAALVGGRWGSRSLVCIDLAEAADLLAAAGYREAS